MRRRPTAPAHGLRHTVGTIEAGKAADLVVSGPPGHSSTRSAEIAALTARSAGLAGAWSKATCPGDAPTRVLTCHLRDKQALPGRPAPPVRASVRPTGAFYVPTPAGPHHSVRVRARSPVLGLSLAQAR